MISTASFPIGATLAPSGGTATGLTILNSVLNNVVKTALADSSEYADMKRFDFTSKDAKVSPGAPNGYTQARRKVDLMFPLSLDNGNSTVNSIKIEAAVDVETTDAELQGYLLTAALVIIAGLSGGDLEDFWARGARS
jgi:hypothetical protein